eukprot:296947-Pelagomonas_calceolata.AAC.1
MQQGLMPWSRGGHGTYSQREWQCEAATIWLKAQPQCKQCNERLVSVNQPLFLKLPAFVNQHLSMKLPPCVCKPAFIYEAPQRQNMVQKGNRVLVQNSIAEVRERLSLPHMWDEHTTLSTNCRGRRG